ncbi:hypothetical protein MXB_5098 [Myxobolus squamalis]|nr:hypothetical protein MXB_5098 [Myxobolus squamalis]
MGFVAAAANIRAHLFGLEKESVFKIKTMAGNVIPAIATTNDIIASLSVIEAIKLLNGTGLTVIQFRDHVLREGLGYMLVDVEMDDSKGSILLSSDENETKHNLSKTLSKFEIGDGSILKVDDFLTDHIFHIKINACDSLKEKLFEIIDTAISVNSIDKSIKTLNYVNFALAVCSENIINVSEDTIIRMQPDPFDSTSKKRKNR